MLASYPTGADKLLASLSEQSEDSQPARESVQPGRRNCATGHETICPDPLRGNVGTTRSCCGTAGADGKGRTGGGGVTSVYNITQKSLCVLSQPEHVYYGGVFNFALKG